MKFLFLLFAASVVPRSASAWAANVAQQPLGQHFSDVHSDNLLQNDELDRYINDVMNEWHCPGMAVSVVRGNDTWAKGYGYASLPSTPVTPHTLFFTGSTTKSFTAAAISLLIDNSSDYASVQWTTPISQLLREDFVLSDEWATQHITIEDALSHRTGYPRHDMAMAKTVRDLVRKFRYLPMSAEPRAKFQYNNMMYATAGYVVTKLTGSPLGAFFRSHLWEPMGLNETFLGLNDPALQDSGLLLADEYYYKNSTGEYLRLKHADLTVIEGAGAVVSNVLDYAKYLRVMMNEEGPISKAGHRELKTARSFYGDSGLPFVSQITYALGWMSAIALGEQMWLHSGQVDEFTTWMLMVPSKKIGITVMTNSASRSLDLVLYRLLYDLFDVKEKDRFDFAAKYRKAVEDEKHNLATCSERLYPSLPSPPLPHTVPLANHTGTFRDPGYGDLYIVLHCAGSEATKTSASSAEESCQLRVRRPEGGPLDEDLVVKLEHKSGDYWLGWVETWDTDNPVACLEVQFRVDAKGVVAQFGINIRREDGVPLVWFERLAP